MASPALEPNATAHGGPCTPAGRERSAQNSLKTGLFAAHDYIREHETEEYAETLANLRAELAPEGHLETTYTAEIMTATWRLRRCGLVEAALAVKDDDISAEQNSIDRARAHSHNTLRHSIAELRKLQTEREIRFATGNESVPGLADFRQVNSAVKLRAQTRLADRKADDLDTLEGIMTRADQRVSQSLPDNKPEPESSFCKSAPAPAPQPLPTPRAQRQTPRNALCPCNSGVKFKRCCGTEAPPVLGTPLKMAA